MKVLVATSLALVVLRARAVHVCLAGVIYPHECEDRLSSLSPPSGTHRKSTGSKNSLSTGQSNGVVIAGMFVLHYMVMFSSRLLFQEPRT